MKIVAALRITADDLVRIIETPIGLT
jgi:hypothetical protein